MVGVPVSCPSPEKLGLYSVTPILKAQRYINVSPLSAQCLETVLP